MPKHMGVDLEGKSSALADTLHKAVDGVGGDQRLRRGYQPIAARRGSRRCRPISPR
jgi:hypothetical protein